MKLPLVVSGTVLDCEAPHGASRLVLVWIKGASFYRGTRLQTPRLRTTSHQALSNNTDLAPRPPTSAFSPSLWKPLVLQAPCQSQRGGNQENSPALSSHLDHFILELWWALPRPQPLALDLIPFPTLAMQDAQPSLLHLSSPFPPSW